MQALRFGERYGYVGRNVAQLVDLPPAPRREGRSLAIEQSERLLSAARGERLEAAIVTGLMLGLRPGELLGLTRTDYSPRRATRHNGMVGIEVTCDARFRNLIIDDLSQNGIVNIGRFYESPFTDISPQGPEELFSSAQIDELAQVVAHVRHNADVA